MLQPVKIAVLAAVFLGEPVGTGRTVAHVLAQRLGFLGRELAVQQRVDGAVVKMLHHA
jgi:hypothetical protein